MALLPALLLAVLSGASDSPPAPGTPAAWTGADARPTSTDDLYLRPLGASHGKVDWFEGTYDELLARARAEGKVVMLSFYDETCRFCARLDREAYSDDDVLAVLEDVLCMSVDADSPVGRELDARYPTGGHYPAVIFLDPDGGLRDRISGYVPVSYFLPELERILRDEGTLGDLRRKVAAAPEDLGHIWAYAQRLDEFGDRVGYRAQVLRLRALDPEGDSQPLRHLAMLDAIDELGARRDDGPLRALLAEETYGELLYLGWSTLARHELSEARRAERADRTGACHAHRLAFHQAHLNAWPHVPKAYRAWFGNHVAWDIYKDWAILSDEVRAKGIEIARIATDLEPGSPDLLDTLACLLFSDGQLDEAIELARRCIALEPDKDLWRNRLALFTAEES